MKDWRQKLVGAPWLGAMIATAIFGTVEVVANGVAAVNDKTINKGETA